MESLTSLNMDRQQRVVIDTNNQLWIASPSPGVWRIPLEREAAESGQVTSLVRYDANTHFTAHFHPNGEEIFVLDGIFQDEHGHYPAGTYIRNPPGSFHSPGSDSGCLLYVKLNMFPPHDDDMIRIDTHNANWQPGIQNGLSTLPLHGCGREQTIMLRWQPGTSFPSHQHDGGEEVLVLSGEFHDELGKYKEGVWLRNPAGSSHQPESTEGCLMLVKSGHMSK
ncbi:cupin domain-containing protein [Photobacterium sp. SDRW27]|uniref:cupin domain-containing protein n=1 Tax=Photobacterium obscurum TaxID=2829490 RepID=UPI0022433FD6|nr:cupin domain-containing protein [Photobacterium obscurum]MCW8331707.1 cupin domain-containing protein [Photobacterium obscurum]